MFSAMLIDAYHDEQPGIRIAYRTDGHLLNSWRMQASTHVSTSTVHDLLFADDCAINTTTEEDMQRSMDLFAARCADFGLTISTAKTVFMHQPPRSAEYNAPESMSTRSNRPERRMVLIIRELAYYKVDIAALSETRFSVPGQLEEVGVGYTFGSGGPQAGRREAGVAFAIRAIIVGSLPCLPQGINY
ncbi:unnamed protein product [Schistocephalus solidus]|uniref:Reverse transcriptase domain-containing protein n=1 Tax=Schistocephalus solidus TaxID=70667 RepID=A0A183TLT9_SCHSO|nr:unnamed protein product [Schistocephalus solidus]